MKIVADYKKRKELKEYLPHEEHWKLKSDRKSVGEKPGAKDQSPAILAPLSPNSAASLAGDTASKLSTQVGFSPNYYEPFEHFFSCFRPRRRGKEALEKRTEVRRQKSAILRTVKTPTQ